MANRPAGAEYHDPPLFLLEEAQRMPPEVQAWIKSLSEGGQWIAEFQLNLVGVDNFSSTGSTSGITSSTCSTSDAKQPRRSSLHCEQAQRASAFGVRKCVVGVA